MVTKEGSPQDKNRTEGKREPLPYTYFVTVDFDVPFPELKHPAKEVLVFGFDTRGADPPVLAPFPIKAGRMNEQEQKDAGKNLTRVVKQDYRNRLHIHQALRFLPLKDMAPGLTPVMRNEIGYALLSLAEDDGTKSARPKFRTALWNTGIMFLLSVGAYGPVEEAQRQSITDLYKKHYAPILGPKPWLITNSHVRFLDAFVKTGKDAKEFRAVQPLDEIAEMGHAYTFILQRVAKNGGTPQIVIGPTGVPKDHGTPIGCTWIALPA